MSFTEVCQEVENWAPQERQQLVRHLKILETINDPSVMAEVSRSLDEIKGGGGVSREELLEHLRARGITLN